MKIWNKIRGYRDLNNQFNLGEISKQFVTKNPELINFKTNIDVSDFFEKNKPQITSKTKSYKDSNDNEYKIEKLLIFVTEYQRTWILAIKNLGVICILDDSRKDKPKLKWLIGINQIKLLNLEKDIKIYDSHKLNYGSIDFGPKHKNWLYSKALYPSQKLIKDSILKIFKKSIEE